MTINKVWVGKGEGVPRKGLVDQAQRSLELEATYQEKLRKTVWRANHRARMEELIQRLETSRAQQLEAKSTAGKATTREGAAIDGVKGFRRMMVEAVRDLRADGLLDDKEAARFDAGDRLYRSTPRLMAYLDDVAPAVKEHDAKLKECFNGESQLEVLEKLRRELKDAQGKQEFARDAAPLETQEFYQDKGELLTLIEKLNRAGRMAFDGQAETRALFNKDLILRARKKRGPEEM